MKSLIYEKDLLGKRAVGITNGRLTIKECDNSIADKLVVKYHYSHKTTKNRFLYILDKKIKKQFKTP